jgi:hypothetical protein
MQIASTKSIADLVSRYVNSHIVERIDPQITKLNLLLTLIFLASCDIDRLKYHKNNYQKQQ